MTVHGSRSGNKETKERHGAENMSCDAHPLYKSEVLLMIIKDSSEMCDFL
jgi:hypothetical protein